MPVPNGPARQWSARVADPTDNDGVPAVGEGGSTEITIPGPGGGQATVGQRDAPAGDKPVWLGLDATGWVSLAMIALIAIAAWKGVFGGIGRALDGRVARVRRELDEARRLRAEAEALLAELAARAEGAERDAARIRAYAERDALKTLEAAGAEAEARVVRRTRQAEDRIAAAERAAEADLRARVATLATAAAARVIGEDADAVLHRRLSDGAIGELERRLA